MLRQEILQMPPEDQLILRPGMRPIRARKIRWFREPEFLARRRPEPEIPELVVEIPMDDMDGPIATQVAPALGERLHVSIGEC